MVARCGNALVISFRGTNDNRDSAADSGTANSRDRNNWYRPDVGDWNAMADHYANLEPLVDALDTYLGTHSEIKTVYVTGHSLGGAMALRYMEDHENFGDKTPYASFEAITFAAPAYYDSPLHPHDDRITCIEIQDDPVPVLVDDYGIGRDPQGDILYFIGNNTLAGGTNNHSMEYYRDLAWDVDDGTWGTLLAQTGEYEILLGGSRSVSNRVEDFVVATADDTLSAVVTELAMNAGWADNRDIDAIYGGAGNDVLTGDISAEWLVGGTGNDILNGGIGNDILNGGTGNDTLIGGIGNDTLIGGTNDDTYVVDRSSELATIAENASEGTDTLQIAYVGSMTLAQNISLTDALGAIENATIAESVEVLRGGESDIYPNGPPPVTVSTGLFNLTGNGADNVLTGNGRTNLLTGGTGNDTLYGQGGGDTLNGGDGNDLLLGGAGGDFLTGGAGDDRFVFTSKLAGDADRVIDFTEGDLLVVGGGAFTGLGAAGALAPGAFVQGTVAMPPPPAGFLQGPVAMTSPQLLYDAAQGHLYYDADGSGIGAKVLVATLTNHAVLDAGDFWVG